MNRKFILVFVITSLFAGSASAQDTKLLQKNAARAKLQLQKAPVNIPTPAATHKVPGSNVRQYETINMKQGIVSSVSTGGTGQKIHDSNLRRSGAVARVKKDSQNLHGQRLHTDSNVVVGTDIQPTN